MKFRLPFLSYSHLSASDNVKMKLLKQLYYETRLSLVTLLALTFVLYAILQDAVPPLLLNGWLFLTASLNLFRLWDTYLFLHRNRHRSETWYNRFVPKAILNAFLWGIGAFIFLPYLDEARQIIVFLFIFGIAGGAINAIAFSYRISTLYLAALLLPITAFFLFNPSPFHYLLGSLVLLYYLMLINVCRSAGSALVAAFEQEEHALRAQNALMQSREELTQLFQQAPIGIFYFDTGMKIISCNHAFCELFDVPDDFFNGFDLHKLPDQRVMPGMLKAIKDGTTQHYSGPYISTKAHEYWIEARCSPLKNADGETIGGITLLENKTKEKKALDELHHIAHHDLLTGLGNRRRLMQFMEKILATPEHTHMYSLLFYLDINRFKQINDSLGHSMGDRLLIQISRRLEELKPANGELCRLGGDEFILVIPFTDSTKHAAELTADHTAKRVQHLFEAPFDIGERELRISASIGIVIIEPEMHNPEEIIRFADISMYQAKRKQRETVSFYNPRLDEERKTLFGLQHDLVHALARHELELYFQPIVRIDTNRVRAAEALLRWNHPKHGTLSPDKFMPIALESGLIDDIGWWVIEAACKQIAAWKEQNCFHLRYLSVNINATQLQLFNFAEKFFTLLSRYGVDPSEIKIELTESSLIENFEQSQETISLLQKRGVLCAIDDFGTGYSSLSYLRRLSFSVLKIDKSFVDDMEHDSKILFLIENVIHIGKRLGYDVIIEGVETPLQRQMINEVNNEVSYQGFLFSPAVNATAFCERFLTPAVANENPISG